MTDKNVSVKVATNPKRAYCVGRNGLAPIKEVSVWQGGEGYSFIDGINRRGKVLNGGLCLDTAAMDKLAQQWLESRAGTTAPKQIYIYVKGGLVQSVYGPAGTIITVIDDDNAECDPNEAAKNQLRNVQLKLAKANGEVTELY